MPATGLALYHSKQSTCCLRVRFVLAEKGMAWADHRLRLDLNEHLAPEYLAINPNGLVPALVHDGQVIVDSSVINEYLEDSFPQHSLRPTSLIERARMRSWIQYLDEATTPAIRYLSFQQLYLPLVQRLSAEQRRQFAQTLPLRKAFWLEMTDAGFSGQRLELELERVVQALNRMDDVLSTYQWLAGDCFSLADVAMMPSIVRLEDLGRAGLWAGLPRVADWYRRLQLRPAFHAAYFPETRMGIGAASFPPA